MRSKGLPKLLALSDVPEESEYSPFPPIYSYFGYPEIETTFLVCLRKLNKRLVLNSLPRERIFQAYIPKRFFEQVLFHLGPRASQCSIGPIAMCRLRRVVHGDALEARRFTQFFVQMKGPRFSSIERREISFPISSHLFNTLMPMANSGFIDKLRYVDQGYTLDERLNVRPAVAHIDLIANAGPDYRRASPAREFPCFALVDVELESAELLDSLTDPQHHSFPYLDSAVHLMDQPRSVAKCFRTRILARRGIHHPQLKRLVRKLLDL